MFKSNTHLFTEHTPFDPNLWTGRQEPYESEKARYWYQLVKKYESQPVSLIGFACDQGVRRNLGRVGAIGAPKSIRTAFAKLPCSATLQNKFETEYLMKLVGDAGDVKCLDDNELLDKSLEVAQADYTRRVTSLIKQNSFVIGIGGGHEIAYASYLGLWKALNSDNKSQMYSDCKTTQIGIINFDAHLDLRQGPKGTSGTPFRQISEHNLTNNQKFNYCAIGISQYSNTLALFDRAEELGVTIISDDSCIRLLWADIQSQLDNFLDTVDVIYLTIDMDGFEAAIVPGVSAPAAKGMRLDFVERCIEYIFSKAKVMIADIAEVNPTYDIDGRSSKVAARLLALIIELELTSIK
ncbi:formimidoylglutamase [Psychrobacter sp. 5A.1]|uniref:formimidoylglutamase n=1 Tax=Psychrobacter sp. 5A.1 TaxID=3035207 RepID=UPI0025B3F2E3|nr:formimidoylglutamase [Psychrobacter sp. 5A.1]MDN3503912.1 formimidoylglutamase [Psychrobacter sp. 5A.1]